MLTVARWLERFDEALARGDLEAAARRMRYAALREMAANAGAMLVINEAVSAGRAKAGLRATRFDAAFARDIARRSVTASRMVLRWLFNLKYLVNIQEIFLNI